MTNAAGHVGPRQLAAQLPQSLRWVWAAAPGGLCAVVGLTLLQGSLPGVMAWVGRRIIDGVVLGARTGNESAQESAVRWVVIELALALLLLVVKRTETFVRESMRVKVVTALTGGLLEKALRLELEHFEKPETADLLANARGEAAQRPLSLVLGTLSFVRSVMMLGSFALLLWGLAWWSVVLLAIAAVPEFLIETRLSGDAYRLYAWRARESRLLAYFESVLTRDTHVKEVKLYGLGPLVLGRAKGLLAKFAREDLGLARKKLSQGTVFAGLSSIAFYGCYAAVALEAARGHISVGDLTLAVVAFRQGQGAFDDVLSSVASMYDDALRASHVGRFFALPEPPPRALPANVLPEGRFDLELEHVSFHYPGSARLVLDDVSLVLKQGERLALVGENGAGKSTIVKLLLGLYQPTSGVIRFGGVDVRTLDPQALRQRVGAVFQDFVRYQLTASENIGLGDLPRLEDAAAIRQAAEQGGALETLEALPKGLGTTLGTWFDDGQELSGGQWQSVAVARSFMRLQSRGGAGADVLILDEPTAAIDAKAELALFERFQRLVVGRSALIISHRFSTVRMADRIAVLEHGKLVELGSHAELVAQGGRYAQLFELQAQGYR